MAKYVELIGAAGVGKSTTYEYLKNLRGENDKWGLFEEEYKNGRGTKQPLPVIIKLLIKRFLGLVSSNPKFRIQYNHDVLEAFRKQNPELVELLWQTVVNKYHSINGKDLRFHAINYMMHIIQKVQTVKELTSDKYYIMDEGLVMNLNYFIQSKIVEENQLTPLLDKLYLPVGVIFFDGDIDTVMERTLSRGKLIVRDENLSLGQIRKSREDVLEEKRISVKAIEAKNIPILRLAPSLSVESKAKKIVTFIDSLS